MGLAGAERGTRPQRGRLDRAAVVEAAAAIADSKGLDAVTLTRVAAAVGRHATSLYNHVDSLQALREDIALLGTRELGEVLWEAVLGRSGVEALEALAQAYRGFVLAHPGRYHALTVVTSDSPEQAAASERAVQAIRAAIRSFGLDEEATAHGHRVLAAAIRGFVAIEGTRGFTDSPDPERTFAVLIELFATSLAEGRWPRA